MKNYNDIISDLMSNFKKSLEDLDLLLQNLQNLLIILESASGGDIKLIREDLQTYYDAYSKIKETAYTKINGIKSRADEYDKYLEASKSKIGESSDSTLDGSTRVISKLIDVYINETNGLAYEKWRQTTYKVIEDKEDRNVEYSTNKISQMSTYEGGLWNGEN